MTDLLLSQIRNRTDDVLLLHKPKAKSSTIFVKENSEAEDLQHFVIVAKGDGVSEVAIGDIVVVSWTRVTTPFEVIDNRQGGSNQRVQVGITNRKEILAVIDGATEHDTIC